VHFADADARAREREREKDRQIGQSPLKQSLSRRGGGKSGGVGGEAGSDEAAFAIDWAEENPTGKSSDQTSDQRRVGRGTHLPEVLEWGNNPMLNRAEKTVAHTSTRGKASTLWAADNPMLGRGLGSTQKKAPAKAPDP
jgi:hypothetical protein